MSRFVLDSTVTMAWCFTDEATAFTETLLRERAQITSHLLTGRRGADTRVFPTPRDEGRDESRPGRLKPAPRFRCVLILALARYEAANVTELAARKRRIAVQAAQAAGVILVQR